MPDSNPFSTLEKNSSDSFHQQKALIKKVMAGKTVNCPHCGHVIMLRIPEKHAQPGLFCGQGCTEIVLDFVDK